MQIKLKKKRPTDRGGECRGEIGRVAQRLNGRGKVLGASAGKRTLQVEGVWGIRRAAKE